MISIAMIVVIILIIGGAMRLGSRSVNAGEKRMESLERVRASLSMIDSQVRSHIPLTYTEDAIKKNYFRGEGLSLQFSSNYSIWLGQRGYVVVRYRVITDAAGKQSLHASENIIGLADKWETKLLDGFDAISFDYFFKAPAEEKGKWIEQWTDENSVPEKIRLHITDGAREISLLMPVRARELPR